MKKIKIILMIIIGVTFMVSCDTTSIQELAPPVTDPTYNVNIAPVFKANCISCHSAGNQYPDLETYTQVKDGCQNGDVLCVIDIPAECFFSKIMPESGRMPQQTIDMIKLWTANGCPE